MIYIFLNALLVGYSGAVMPGALLTYTINQSLKKGAKTGVLITIGHAVLELILIIFLLAGAGSILKSNVFQIIISILGGIFMVYLGLSMFKDVIKNKLTLGIEENAKTHNHYKLILSGMTISLANPYFLIWWAIVGLNLLTEAYTTIGMTGIVIFYFGHILADLSWYIFVSYVISKTSKFISLKIYKIIVVALATFLLYFGLSFLLHGVSLM